MTVRMRHTRAHTRNRRSHHGLTLPRLSKDKEGEGSTPSLRHRVSPITGRYRGKVVVDIAQISAKKLERKKKRTQKENTPPSSK